MRVCGRRSEKVSLLGALVTYYGVFSQRLNEPRLLLFFCLLSVNPKSWGQWINLTILFSATHIFIRFGRDIYRFLVLWAIKKSESNFIMYSLRCHRLR